MPASRRPLPRRGVAPRDSFSRAPAVLTVAPVGFVAGTYNDGGRFLVRGSADPAATALADGCAETKTPPRGRGLLRFGMPCLLALTVGRDSRHGSLTALMSASAPSPSVVGNEMKWPR